MAFCRPSRTGRCAPACRLHKPGAKQAPNTRPRTRQALAYGLLMWAGGLLAAAPVFAQTPSGCAVPVVPGGAGLGLQDALARVDCHPLVRRAAAQLQAARADQTTAGQRPNPNLAVGAYSIPRTGMAAGRFMDKPFDHQLRVDQLIERGGKRALRQEAAAGQVRSADRELAQARADAQFDLAAAFLDVQSALARSEALRAFVVASTQTLVLLDARVRAGDAPAIEAARWRTEHARLQAEEASAQAETAAARARLAVAMGLSGPVPTVAGTLDGVDLSRLDADTPTDVLLGRRADVRAAVARTQAAERLVRLAQAQRTRDVTIGVQADRYPSTPANPSGNGNTVSFGASVPLFLAHAFEGEIARAQADWQWAQDQEALVREAAGALIEQSRAERRSSLSRLRLAELELLPAAERLAQAAEAAWARGGSSLLELIEARRALRAARLEVLNARAEAAKATWRWQSLDTP